MPAVTDKLVPPPKLRKIFDSFVHDPQLTPEDIAELELGWTLSYYYGGGYMWSRGHGADMEVLFAGTGDETAAWWEEQDPDLLPHIALSYVPTWKQTKSEIGIRD